VVGEGDEIHVDELEFDDVNIEHLLQHRVGVRDVLQV
jgi:hypothetical protein